MQQPAKLWTFCVPRVRISVSPQKPICNRIGFFFALNPSFLNSLCQTKPFCLLNVFPNMSKFPWSNTKQDFDVIIIGGGPAGAALASYLVPEGITTLILEKESFPRDHVGESLVPASNRVFHEIGFMEVMEQAGFQKKTGASWTADGKRYHQHGWDGIEDDCKVGVEFNDLEENDAYTFHVDRSKFDQLLLNHAESKGAQVEQHAKVTKVNFHQDDYHEVIFIKDSHQATARAALVVDASGRFTFIGNRLKLKVKDPHFDQFAIHSWFKNFDRGSDRASTHIQVHFLPIPNSWIWQIPITDDITSIGIVSQATAFKEKGIRPEKFFDECLNEYPQIAEKINQSEQVKPLKVEGDYSYAMKEITGDGWALVGDAARFVDPIFSSGVSIALNSSRILASNIIQHKNKLRHGHYFSKSNMDEYASALKKGTAIWYEFITIYYRLNVLFTLFVDHPKYHKDVLKLLSGDVYNDERPKVLDVMQSFVDEIEANPDHILHDKLGELSANQLKEVY